MLIMLSQHLPDLALIRFAGFSGNDILKEEAGNDVFGVAWK